MWEYLFFLSEGVPLPKWAGFKLGNISVSVLGVPRVSYSTESAL